MVVFPHDYKENLNKQGVYASLTNPFMSRSIWIANPLPENARLMKYNMNCSYNYLRTTVFFFFFPDKLSCNCKEISLQYVASSGFLGRIDTPPAP